MGIGAGLGDRSITTATTLQHSLFASERLPAKDSSIAQAGLFAPASRLRECSPLKDWRRKSNWLPTFSRIL